MKAPWRATVPLVLATLPAALMAMTGTRLNWTESMPRGVYRETAPRLERGAFAMVCLEGVAARLGREREYLPRGDCASGVMPVVKEIVAVPGDRVRLQRSGLVIDGQTIAGTRLLDHDTNGRPLGHARLGERRLEADEFWLLGRSSSRSWDSRYFGAVSRRQVIGTVTPWLAWTTADDP